MKIGPGVTKVYCSSPGVSRSFCADCGTPLSYEDERLSGEIYVPVGFFDHPEPFAPEAHNWVFQRLECIDIPDGLARH